MLCMKLRMPYIGHYKKCYYSGAPIRHTIEWGFKLNEYDQCVANEIINVIKCTLLSHVDDLKLSHVEAKVLEDVIKKLNSKFGKKGL